MSRTSKERDIGREVLEGLQQLKSGKVGRVVSFPPISKVRERVGLSQAEFAKLLGVSVRTLQAMETEEICSATKL